MSRVGRGPARTPWCAVAVALLLALCPTAGRAQTAQGSPEFFGLFGSQWQVGGVVFVTPKFEGAKSYEAVGFPFVAPAGLGDDGVVQIKGADNVRFRVLQAYGFEAGPLLGWRFGRDEDDSDRLRVLNNGLGDIDGGLVAGGYAGYRAGPVLFSVSYHHQVTGDDTGGVVRLGLDHTARLTNTVRLTSSIGAAWASDDYMTSYFGVSAPVAALTGLPAYRPDAGFKDVSAGLTAFIDLDRRWTLLLTGRYTHLIGDAADSPIVESESQFFGGVGLSYKFDVGW
jgi:outer membrane scaffolding protein for murein synthesis (MipA/OmpV family)